MFSLVVNGREEKISAAKKEPLQIMQEVIHIAAATPSSECVPVFRVCIVLYKSLFDPVYYTVLTMTSFFLFFQTWKFSKRWWHIKWRPKAHKHHSVMCNSCHVKKNEAHEKLCANHHVMNYRQLHVRCKQHIKYAKKLEIRLLETDKEEVVCSVRLQ